ncbi:hypothetical protein BOSE62_71347 [Bosea sp. 62]|uniref:hypothetical protein n=1 Tax=unclassified Bosea (in: a-proteobacteria) TaxID=2653178 RepID=UPI001255B6BA|nr:MULTISPECIES: hypothetical protein [unclassified Bosea (in: a-proteobacteria)]CAD5294858.1 hypothetical protein BOSE21B_90279 [Bosea sp. 21B]CAD5295319.1 hypothetical protein BOSE46_80376 [Bosea sp. 46]CAD5298475.1 hypothetical protein BOSE7B_60385 [Bosea sp. 7B]VVT60926.1 hypothetical protein BOS5A_230203 [Bosea sp. EC-HK365B]VXB36226.1 hypothetical protein BOSE127_110384 [Bosea sp. 127]
MDSLTSAFPPPAVPPFSKIVFDLHGLHCLFSPSPPFAQFLEAYGLDCAVTIPEVSVAFLEGYARAARCRPIGGELLLAHSEAIASSLGRLDMRSLCSVGVRQKMLANPVVQRLLSENPRWRLQAMVVAAAVGHGMPILGFGSFYRVFDRHFRISTGVCDPRNGEWLVPPIA